MTIETRPTTVPEVLPRERTVSDVLLAAARYIEEHGWTQGAYERGEAVCVRGAINAVVCGDPETDTSESIEASVTLIRHLHGRGAAGWNDTPGRTEAEVIAALRAAAGSEA